MEIACSTFSINNDSLASRLLETSESKQVDRFPPI